MVKKPNILFLVTDDQRFNTINALGNKEILTPNLDKLVSEGTAFTHAHIPGGTSGAVCMPSRAMFNTSRTLFHLEGEGQEIPLRHTTLGENFRKNGYETFGTGKWHNGVSSYARSFSDGDEIFFGGMWDHWNVPTSNYDPCGKYDNAINFTQNFMLSNHPMKIHCDKYSKGKHSTELFGDTAINFIKNYKSEEPFYLYTAFLAPHDPRTMPERFKKMYDPEKISLPPNFCEEHPFDYGIKEIRDELLCPYPRTPQDAKKHIAEYYAMISHLDYKIGEIIKALEDCGKIDDTIIVLAGDNGLAVGQHGLFGKQSLYEHSIRVPLIFKGPGIPKNIKVDSFAYLLDIYPTLCTLADIEIPSSVEGKSLVPLMHDPSLKVRDYLYLAYTDLIRGVKDERFKLIEYTGVSNMTQLFDLNSDPYELNNLYGKSEYEDTVKTLREKMESLRDEWDDMKHPMGKVFWERYKKTRV